MKRKQKKKGLEKNPMGHRASEEWVKEGSQEEAKSKTYQQRNYSSNK